MGLFDGLFKSKPDPDMEAMNAGVQAGHEIYVQSGQVDWEQLSAEQLSALRNPLLEKSGIPDKGNRHHMFQVGILYGVEGQEWCEVCKEYHRPDEEHWSDEEHG